MSQFLLLLVEDSEDDLAVTLRAIRNLDAGVEVVIAFDGESGAVALGLGPEPNPQSIRPDLLLLDLKMPKLGGMDLLRMIRQDPSTRDIPVVIFSSSSLEEDITTAKSFGAEYETKPVDFLAYVIKVKEIVRRWLPAELTEAHRVTLH